MRIRKMNKRGDIPVTILVLGVLAICLFAIFSFYTSDGNVKEDFQVVGAVEEASLVRERIELHRNLGFEEAEIKEIFGIEKEGGRDFITIQKDKINVSYILPVS